MIDDPVIASQIPPHADPCAGLMFGQRLRRWPNIKTTQGQRVMFFGIGCRNHSRKESVFGL